ncbi:hypothetical protein [Kitasatospora sp. MY 5-36]|uniref:hypothetical protein n=1 Tax=Kitasatospora sp. MY 5-36 TaxID=1678027 RepID=UPI0006718089|nr:hypothetical protein [Kitasatospora sp. MY 5-36]
MNDNERPDVQYGDRVTIHGGSGNVGIQHNNGAAGDQALPPEVAALFARLATVVTELARDGRLHEADRQSLAEALPVLTSPAAEEPRSRRNTLLLLAGLAQSVGEAAAPALGLANQLLALLSG